MRKDRVFFFECARARGRGRGRSGQGAVPFSLLSLSLPAAPLSRFPHLHVRLADDAYVGQLCVNACACAWIAWSEARAESGHWLAAAAARPPPPLQFPLHSHHPSPVRGRTPGTRPRCGRHPAPAARPWWGKTSRIGRPWLSPSLWRACARGKKERRFGWNALSHLSLFIHSFSACARSTGGKLCSGTPLTRAHMAPTTLASRRVSCGARSPGRPALGPPARPSTRPLPSPAPSPTTPSPPHPRLGGVGARDHLACHHARYPHQANDG